MRLDTPYYRIPGDRPEGTFGAIMEILLRSRLKLQLDKEEGIYDEDVNAYLAGVLMSYIDPTYLSSVEEVLSKHDFDVFQAVQRTREDRAHIYWIYKVNADDLLVSLGIFRRLWQEAKGELGRLKRYYAYASDYQRRIYGKVTAVGDIQNKISAGPERYLNILSEARNDYLHFLDQMGPSELAEFNQRIQQFEHETPVRSKQDEVLDAFSACLKEPSSLEMRQRLLALLEELKTLDPAFRPEFLLTRLDQDKGRL